jgi:hypothetical protein
MFSPSPIGGVSVEVPDSPEHRLYSVRRDDCLRGIRGYRILDIRLGTRLGAGADLAIRRGFGTRSSSITAIVCPQCLKDHTIVLDVFSRSDWLFVVERGKRRATGPCGIRIALISEAIPAPLIGFRTGTAPKAGSRGPVAPELGAAESHGNSDDEDNDGNEDQCKHENRTLQVPSGHYFQRNVGRVIVQGKRKDRA